MTEEQAKYDLMLRHTTDKDRSHPGEIRRAELVSMELVHGLRRIEKKLDELIRNQNDRKNEKHLPTA